MAEIYGTPGDDNIIGTDESDYIVADSSPFDPGGGDDTVRSGKGADVVYGGGGNDLLDGGSGDDHIAGGGGNDTLIGGIGNDMIDSGNGRDEVYGGYGQDTLYSWEQSSHFDSNSGIYEALLDGGPGGDYLVLDRSLQQAPLVLSLADPSVDQFSNGTTFRSIERIFLFGGAGDDIVTGGDRNDGLGGGDGDDTLDGGGGADSMIGGAGKDTLTGGAGADVFRFLAGDSKAGGGVRDIITDFEVGLDKLDVSGLHITDFAAQVSYKPVGSGLIVYIDTNQNGLDYSDFGVQLTGVKGLQESDFLI